MFDNLFFWCIFGFFFGLGLFYKGFKWLKLKRTIENLPTSKIRSIAMGIVEIFGVIVPEKILKSPFTNKDCVYYKYLVEEYKSSGKHSRWVIVKKGEEKEYFYVRDETGTVLIDPTKAQIEIPADFTYSSGIGNDPTQNIMQFLKNNRINHDGFFGFNKKMRYTEFILSPSDKIYIIGTAGNNPFLKDGNKAKNEDLIMIQKGNNDTYYISDSSEKNILDTLKFKVIGGIWGGAALTVVCLAIIFIYLGIF